MPVGQIVGRMNEIRPATDIVAELVSGVEAASRRLDDRRVDAASQTALSRRDMFASLRRWTGADIPGPRGGRRRRQA